MPIQRVFLDWSKPGLVQTIDYLWSQFATTTHQNENQIESIDLSSLIIVVPGRQAGRRLNELLLRRIRETGAGYFPPRVCTVGSLPEMLYTPAFPFAGELVQHFAWAKALQEIPRKQVQEIVSQTPGDSSDPRWVELGMMLHQQHRELAGDGYDFADVAKLGQAVPGFDEAKRWQAMAAAQRKYLDILDGLKLWDRQTARLVAVKQKECETQKSILLVATADMNRVLRQMLDQVDDHVTSLIMAPESLADHFDAYGCIEPEAWATANVDLNCDSISHVENPSDQAYAIAHVLRSLKGEYSTDEISIGTPDEKIVSSIQSTLLRENVNTRWGAGQLLEVSRPFRFLRCLVDYLQRHDFTSFAELLRHPDVRRWLRGKHVDTESLLAETTRYQNKHLPSTANYLVKDKSAPQLFHALKQLTNLFETLEERDSHGPGDWAPAISTVLAAVYHDRQLDLEVEADRMTMHAADAIRDSLDQLQLIPDSLANVCTADQAILMLLGQLKSQRSAPLPDPTAIEFLGWLDLPLDDAPVVIVTGFNDGVVPSSNDSDLFLPNGLRDQLKLNDDQRLCARDIYATSVLAASKKELRIVVGRRRADGELISPSRLLFATDAQTVVRRSLRFFDEKIDDCRRTHEMALKQHQFSVPRPERLSQPIDMLRVTDFRSYLECPYRFYLKRVRHLEEQDDTRDELDGGSFGSLLHDVMEDFGVSDVKDSTDAQEIAELLTKSLVARSRKTYGRYARPAVKIQVEQLRLRMIEFAKKQARWRMDGWRIYMTESKSSDVITQLIVDDEPIRLKGRIDRIDRHDDSGEFAILDYKSSDRGSKPQQTHLKSGAWIDLQLPLYQHLARELKLSGPFKLGYILLPREIAKVGFELANWSESQLEEADEVAYQVVRDIRDERFWPPTYPPAFRDEFARICQDEVFDRNVPELFQEVGV